MPRPQINLSPDLKKLREDGYEVDIRENYVLIHNVPYVNSKKELARGVLVSSLNSIDGKTVKPDTHIMYFKGEHPHYKDGSIISGIQHTSNKQDFGGDIQIDCSFSNKPRPDGFPLDYYEKFTHYIRILEAQAQAIDPSVSSKTFKNIESTDTNAAFKYSDTNSTRAEIINVTTKLKNLKIAIIGLGGTGSYILDFVSKTPVAEIHIFDGDDFLVHNAFRAPGAASVEELRKRQKKTAYLFDKYSKMKNDIIVHEYFMDESKLVELSEMNFVFICVDKGNIKKIIIQKLISLGIEFLDVGAGINLVDGALIGSVRVTTFTKEKNDHVDSISFSYQGDNDYDKNIQIAEVNAINAAFAVIKWKKLFGFYHDQVKEHQTIYDISANLLVKKYETKI